MKSFSLKNIRSHVEDLDEHSYQNFKSNLTSYKTMWSSQGFEFWIKFVISLRDVFSTSSSKYDDRCEREMINFLKVLTDKTFSDTSSYIAEAHLALSEKNILQDKIELNSSIGSITVSEIEDHGHLRTIILKLKCAGTFVNILQEWTVSNVGNNFSFVPPETWCLPVPLAEPFEAYIRSKWGNNKKNLEHILGCKIEELGWWDAPAKRVDQSKLKTPETGRLATPAAPSSNLKKKKKNVKEELPKNTRKTIQNVPLWMQTQLQSQVFLLIPKPPQLSEFQSKIKPLLQLSIPPLLHAKYHTVSPTELDDGKDVSKRYMGVAPWYMLVCDTFSNTYLNFVNNIHKKFCQVNNMPRKPKVVSWLSKWNELRDHDKFVLLQLRDRVYAPNVVTDNVSELSEFILEPFIHLQLPWQPAMYRQWLAASLIEILSFELLVVQFRHWPVTQELEPIICNLLFLVSNLKERILLGWFIVCYEATLKTGTESHYPVQILEHVLIPSLPALKFICSQESKQIVLSLKKLCWSNFHQPPQDKIIISSETYSENNTMSNFFVKFYGHFMFWDVSNSSCPTLFPTFEHTDDSLLKEQSLEIKNRTLPVAEGKPFSLQVLKTDEEQFLSMIQSEYIGKCGSTNLDKALQIIKKVLPKCSHFSQENSRKILKILESEEAKQVSENIFNPKHEPRSPLEHLILSSVFCFEISKRMSKESGILDCLINLSAQVMEKEQLVRIFAACSLLVNECPKVCSLELGKCAVSCSVSKSKPMNIQEMTNILSHVLKKTKNFNRKQFFSSFPEELKNPVDSSLPFLTTLNDGTPAAITDLELRVRRFVWNIAQQSYEKTKVLKQDAYMHSSLVQYMLPCYISLLIESSNFPHTPRDNKKRENIFNFVCGIIAHYEATFEAWLSGYTIQERYTITDEADQRLRTTSTMSSYLVESISFALHAYAGIGRLIDDSNTMPHFKNLVSVMLEYCMFNSMSITSQIEFFNCNAQHNLAYCHFYVLHKVCYTKLGIPSPEAILYCHELQDIYSANAIIHYMETFYTRQMFTIKFQTGISSIEDMVNELSRPIRLWRYELFLVLFETEGKFEHPKSMLQNFIGGKGKYMLKQLFDAFVTVRNTLKPHDIAYHYFPTYNCTEFIKLIQLYRAGQLKTLPLFQQKNINIPERIIQKPGVLKKCNNCRRQERQQGTFNICKNCVDEKYPLPNYFCSDRCEEAWWQTEHQAEHLEFELGLSDFSDINL